MKLVVFITVFIAVGAHATTINRESVLGEESLLGGILGIGKDKLLNGLLGALLGPKGLVGGLSGGGFGNVLNKLIKLVPKDVIIIAFSLLNDAQKLGRKLADLDISKDILEKILSEDAISKESIQQLLKTDDPNIIDNVFRSVNALKDILKQIVDLISNTKTSSEL